MKRDLTVYLNDILESTEKIKEYTKGMREKRFYKDYQVQDAVIRRLEIIGEAVKCLPLSFRSEYKKIQWKNIAGLRDVLIHEYFGVSIKRVWLVVRKDLPKLSKELKKLSTKEGSGKKG